MCPRRRAWRRPVSRSTLALRMHPRRRRNRPQPPGNASVSADRSTGSPDPLDHTNLTPISAHLDRTCSRGNHPHGPQQRLRSRHTSPPYASRIHGARHASADAPPDELARRCPRPAPSPARRLSTRRPCTRRTDPRASQATPDFRSAPPPTTPRHRRPDQHRSTTS